MEFKDIKELTQALNKKYGKDLIKSGSKIEYTVKIPMREPKLDYILGGGLPLNRFIEFIGDPTSGKTRDVCIALESFQKFCFSCYTFNLKAVWTTDKAGYPELKKVTCKCKNPKTCINVIIDIEGTIDLGLLEYFDVDIAGIYYCRSESQTMTTNLLEAYLRSSKVGLIVADGIGMQSSDAEVEKAAEDIKMNSGARMSNLAMRKFLSALNSNTNNNNGTSPTTVILVNRMYKSLGMYSADIIQGGGGLKHGKAVSILRRRPSSSDVYLDAKKRDKVIGFHRKLKIEKNKAGVPEKKIEQFINLDLADPIGYLRADIEEEYLEIALELEVIVKKAGWYFIGDEKIQGRDNLKLYIKENENVRKEVNLKLYGKKEI